VKCKEFKLSFCFAVEYLFYFYWQLHYCNGRDKLKTNITKKEEESQQLAVKIQEMQSAMQKPAVEAAKAVAAGQS
jgi:hypothetical protein